MRKAGGAGIVAGSWRAAEAIAELTSCAAASMSRSSANWIVMRVMPWPLSEVIESMPAIVENCFSRTVATAEAIVSGLAPGNEPVTWMVGKSMFGRVETGSRRKPAIPKIRIPAMISTVMTGRRMKISERFMRGRLSG